MSKKGRRARKDKVPDIWPEDQPANVGDCVLPFGRYRGKKLYDVPYSYLEWILEYDFDKELKTKVMAFLNRQTDYVDEDDIPF